MNINDLPEVILDEMLMEMAFYISPTMKKILDNIPKVTRKEFINRAQPCDIIVAFSPKKSLSSVPLKFLAKIVATFQGSPYTSSKVVLDKEDVGGYGIKSTKGLGDSKLQIVPIKQAMNDRVESCLIRLPDLTDGQKKKIISYIRKRKGMLYSSGDLFKTVWNRATNRKALNFMNDRSMDTKEIKKAFVPLFCSTIISTIFYALKKIKFNNSNPYDTWPKDFVLDDRTEKICKIDYT